MTDLEYRKELIQKDALIRSQLETIESQQEYLKKVVAQTNDNYKQVMKYLITCLYFATVEKSQLVNPLDFYMASRTGKAKDFMKNPEKFDAFLKTVKI